MRKCILCGSELSHREKPEHVLLNALGGKKKTRTKVCSNCNNAMGSGPDSDLAKSVVTLRNIANFYAGDGTPPPAIRNLEVGGVSFDLDAGGIPTARISNGLKFENTSNKKAVVNIRARDVEQLRGYVPHIASKLKVSEKSVFEQLAKAQPKIQAVPAPTTPFRMQFGEGESLRSIVKSCFVLWALQNNNEDLLSKNYDEVRRFIRNGEPRIKISIDTRPLPQTLRDFCPHPTFIWAGTDATNTAWAYFSLYGVVGWSIRLSNANTSSQQAIALISNPEHPESWKCDTTTAQLVSADWVKDTPEYSEVDFGSLQRRVTELMENARDRAVNALIERTIYEALEYYDLAPGQVVSDEFAWKVSGYIAHRLAHLLLRQSHEVPIHPEKLKAE